ncbi:hypothetical protein COT40_02390 [Candidatus Peregrinibacteria bacterium CG08_land_8_20_14_0_20_41_10]|nr:MAG: hypothetical protein COT40_02390 [Candidatus Peregrinibacteria bacterium CG08_land_8_20_14_0_20_41_10]
MYKLTQFKNQLRLLATPFNNTEVVTVLVLVKAGSRLEDKSNNGIAHFLEHLFFKGAKKYPNSKKVSEAIDEIGGIFNAFTAKEYVAYYVKVRAAHFTRAVDVLADMLIHAKLDETEIQKEKGVILEEYNMYQDTPMHLVENEFEQLVFGDQSLGWDQLGTPEFIQHVNRQAFVDYRQEFYFPANIVISVAGKTPANLPHVIEKNFDFPHSSQTLPIFNYQRKKSKPKVHLHSKKTEQAHLVLGMEGYSLNHPDYFASKVLAVILGGNMSSRMFQSVREKKGLAYYVQTSSSEYTDTGLFYTRAGVSIGKIQEAIKTILEEHTKIKTGKVTAAELRKAKEYLKGHLLIELEDSEEVAHFLGRQALLKNQILLPNEILEKLEQVNLVDLHRVTTNLFQPHNFQLALIGPYDSPEPFQKLLP